MPFYKKESDELLVAPNFVRGPGFDLFAEQRSEYLYPVDGWYWFDDLDAAIASFAGQSAPAAGVTPRQIRQAMTRIPFGAGTLREAVEAVVAAGDQDLQDWWQFSMEFRREHPQVLAMATALGKTEVELDALFALAMSL